MDSEIQLLQNIEDQATKATADEATALLDKIAAIINEVVGNNENATSIQTKLNIGFRIYYKLLYKYKLQDKHFDELFEGTWSEKPAGKLEMAHSVLLSERGIRGYVDTHAVKSSFLIALKMSNGNSTLLILKNINLLLRKHPKLDIETSLAQIYVYLQSNETGMREEALMFFNHCCRPVERARTFFQFIVTHYPWTNRNKFYMLSSILKHHNLYEFLEKKVQNDFFDGLRLGLSYKHLLPASQYLIKSLSKHGTPYLLEFSAKILTRGTLKEVQNFYSNWFSRIDQKDILFQLLLSKEDVQKSLLDFSAFKKSNEAYRFILIFVMYSRQILEISKLHFFKIITELITNYFEFEKDAQYLIYKFVAENMCCFALEDCLEFLFEFIQNHRNVESAQMRNNVLGKMPTIINYIAKDFFKSQKFIDSSSSLHSSVELFFRRLQQIVVEDVESKIYQPKIFALKLLDIKLKSLYQENLEKLAKNCNLAQNERLGAFLISRGIFDAAKMSEQLVKALNDPQGFDDALALIVELLQRLQIVEPELMIEACQKCCQSVDIDECALSVYYAKAALQSNKNEFSSSSLLYNYAYDMLRKEIPSFQRDALLTCKQKNHLFGYLATINEVLQNDPIAHERTTVDFKYTELLDFIEDIQRMVLEFLNVNGQCDEELFAASFYDMDQSLQVLVEQSKFRAANDEECRKFLLMSFWLTLKNLCDTATTLGFHFTEKQQNLSYHDFVLNTTAYTNNIQRCLNLHTTLLTRCRHKGAIEAAGLSIGKLTRKITSYTKLNKDVNKILWDDCLSLLFDNQKSVSTTRRGAGYSIMFLHIIKNDSQYGRPLLKRSMTQIFEILQIQSTLSITESSNCDRIEALTLHYLCVLVKDAEMRNAIYPYYNEIMLAAISKIDDRDWTICNAALQLFGALVSKVVGQRQGTEFEVPLDWEPTQVTYTEIIRNMSNTFEHILNYCKENAHGSSSTRSIILFLAFLSKIEYLHQDTEDNDQIMCIRELMWLLLHHSCEKVRKLAADCFVRAHDFRHLTQILLHISDLVFQIRNENFFEGLLFVISEGFAKIQNEALHSISYKELSQFYQSLRENLLRNGKFEYNFKPYTHSKLLDTLRAIGFDKNSSLISDLSHSLELSISITKYPIGYEEWSQNIRQFRNED